MANVEDNIEGIDRATKVLQDLRASWSELESLQRTKSQEIEHVSQTSKAA